MAKSRKRNGGSADLRPIKVTLEPSDTTTVYYVNFFEVANTPYDFTLLGLLCNFSLCCPENDTQN
jgi:hypothetical protein